MTDENRDMSVGRLFERDVRPGPEPGEADMCPDAETIAAWADHGLTPAERAQLETHLADCARCQMHLATMAKMTPAEAATTSSVASRSWRWLIPATGAIAAAGLWLMVQTPPAQQSSEVRPSEARPSETGPSETRPPEAPQNVQLQPPEQKLAAVPKRDEARPPNASVSRQMEDSLRKQEAIAQDLAKADKQEFERSALEARSRDARNAPATAPPAHAAEAPAIGRLAETITVQSARAAEASQIANLQVRRLADGRVTWDTTTSPMAARLTAGASPTPSVIWLVGKGGLVLLSTDGRSWRLLSFPEPVDLTDVQASSDAAATVTTADARTYTTSDGGLTWRRQ